jgi:hypothetical protein
VHNLSMLMYRPALVTVSHDNADSASDWNRVIAMR